MPERPGIALKGDSNKVQLMFEGFGTEGSAKNVDTGSPANRFNTPSFAGAPEQVKPNPLYLNSIDFSPELVIRQSVLLGAEATIGVPTISGASLKTG
ncbi:hypothetical protein [Pedobacter sp. UYEF25]